MRGKIVMIVWMLTGLVSLSMAQDPQRGMPQRQGFDPDKMPKEGVIFGLVIDGDLKRPMEYANIVIYRYKDSTMVTGTVTDKEGKFRMTEVPYGFYYLTVNFIGYDKLKMERIKIVPNQKTIDLGTIEMKQASMNLKEVNIVSDRAPVDYKIDKKVVNVSQNINAESGTIADVLENIPSVNVDIEGNVSLRGSGNFTVLIDGRPSALKGNDALQQLPASTVENIEIITNPSAKYDPDGQAGIINIILKKNKLSGVSGVLNASAGTKENYNGNLLLSFRNSKVNVFAGLDYRTSRSGGNNLSEREDYSIDTTFYNYSNGERIMKRYGYGVRAGADFFLNDKNTLTLNGNYGLHAFGHESWSHVHTFSSPSTFDQYNSSESTSERGGFEPELSLNFQHRFNLKGHEMNVLVNFSDEDQDDTEDQTEYQTDQNWNKTDIYPYMIKTLEGEKSINLRTTADYSRPIGEKGMLEGGYQLRYNDEQNKFTFDEFDTLQGKWISNPLYSNNLDYLSHIHSIYSTYANEMSIFSYKLGLRGEYTYRNIVHEKSDTPLLIDRFDVFPTIHLSKQFLKTHQVQVSYSRRIDRPRGWDLMPFPSYINKYTIRMGNPELDNEYTGAYELGYQKRIGASFIALDGYYRNTNNKITRIELKEKEQTIYTQKNMNKEASTGAELMVNMDLFEWLRINLSSNYYHYTITGNISNQDVDNSSNNWNIRMNASVTIKKNTRLQFMGFYNGPSATAQGTSEGFFMTNASARQDFFSDKLTVTLQARDLFNSMRHENKSYGSNFYSYTNFQRQGRVISMSISYKINNYKKDRKPGDRENMNDGMNDEMDSIY